ncbi:MAG: alanine--tRNA ligase, partial [Bacteroidales bacterium]|nr:alanine--tRNA ligase [Bacteroidales bacterium]
AGIRRIEAVTGEDAEALVNGMQDLLKTARSFFNNVPDLAGAIRKMIDDNATFKKQAEEFAKAKAVQLARSLTDKAQEINGIKLIKVNPSMGLDFDPAMLRNAALALQKELKNTAMVAAYEAAGKPQLLLMYSDDLVAAGRHAGKEIGAAARLIQGGGGGQSGLATAGGKDIAGLNDALEMLVKTASGQ